ncbi:MAG: cell filamentation protein Fic [Rhodocyclales bacterium GWA2_65_20]|nr:MAG: cell filamentation protein Fic [Rhodocyclales bacterium GWA2_65_20]
MNLDYPPGATPLDPDEAAELIPSHIANHGQLNEWEMVNILEGERWAFGRRHKDLLGSEFVCRLHKRMFGNTWRWAGKFRTTEKNIGVAPLHIQPTLRNLCEDVKAQLAYASYPLDEIAARFSHRLVAIHPFANGNGRLSRTLADLLLVQHGAPRFTWGAGNLFADGEVRQRYLASLRAADGKDYGLLLAFVRS